MMHLLNEKGTISVSANVYTNIAGAAATNCFGVKGMALRSMKDGLVHLLRKESLSKGVRVSFLEDKSIDIDLHIIIDKKINIKALGDSIINEVRYVVEKTTGTKVRKVNVFVDSISVN